MNKIFTLLACACVFSSPLLAQPATTVDQHFESQVEVDELAYDCWALSNVGYTGVSPIGGSLGSLQSTATASSTVTTPFVNIPTDNLAVRFTYKVISTSGGNNNIQLELRDASNKPTSLIKIDLNGPTGEVVYTNTFTSVNTPGKNISGIRKFVITVVNAVVQIDDLTINAPYTYPGGCAPAAITLPVKLINFQGAVQSSKAQLKWAVAENETGDHFEVLKSADGKKFTAAGVVFINGKIGAESYSFNDAVELEAVTYYQLKIVNKDGSTTYSNVLALKNATAKQGSALTLLQNPVAATLSFSYTSATATQSQVAIYTTSGVKVYSSRISSLKGTNAVSLPLDRHMAAGTYILEISNETERVVSKLIKQ